MDGFHRATGYLATYYWPVQSNYEPYRRDIYLRYPGMGEFQTVKRSTLKSRKHYGQMHPKHVFSMALVVSPSPISITRKVTINPELHTVDP